MDGFVNKFTSLLLLTLNLKEYKVKIQRFINFLPFFYKERIEFDNIKIMDERIRGKNFATPRIRIKMITLRIGWKRRMKNLMLKRKDLIKLHFPILLKESRGGIIVGM